MNARMMLLAAALGVLAASCSPKDRVKPTKNVIFMLTDGTSEGSLAAARWYQRYMTGDNTFNLNLDPYICGLVQTHESDCAITCSAPGMSAYMTGVLGRMGNVSIHPAPHPEQDFFPVDSARAYQPAATVLEAAKYWQGKATGMVFTVEFPHATPAAASAHYPYRWGYPQIALQQACKGLDVVLGGGCGILTDEMRGMISDSGATLLENDIEGFRNFGDGRLWALFGHTMTDFEIDRDDSVQPSLTEMTAKALKLLSKNRKGFFLMVEGSKVDYGSHSTDPVEIITELLEFDRAVKLVMDFAKKDGNTTVVIVSDHGNSGFQIGGGGFPNYEEAPIDSIYAGIRNCKASSYKMVQRLQGCREDEIEDVFKQWTGITLRPQELKDIKGTMHRTEGNYMEVAQSGNLQHIICKIYTSRTQLKFIGGQHTGEDVFLGVYNPNGQRPCGVIRNVDLNAYVCKVLGLRRPLDELTDELFAPHGEVFAGRECSIEEGGDVPVLVVSGADGSTLRIPAYHNVVYRSGANGADTIRTKAACVYMPDNGKFYLERSLGRL